MQLGRTHNYTISAQYLKNAKWRDRAAMALCFDTSATRNIGTERENIFNRQKLNFRSKINQNTNHVSISDTNSNADNNTVLV